MHVGVGSVPGRSHSPEHATFIFVSLQIIIRESSLFWKGGDMSIRVKCPSCGKTVKASDKHAGKTAKCPGCGTPMQIPVQVAQAVPQAPQPATTAAVTSPTPPAKEQDLLKLRPAIFRTRPMKFTFCVLLLLLGSLAAQENPQTPQLWALPFIFGLILVIWCLQSLTTTFSVTNKRSMLRKGILSKHTREVRHSDVRLLQVDQSFFQRMLGVGTVSVASAGSGEVEIMVAGLKNPEHIKETIDGYRP